MKYFTLTFLACLQFLLTAGQSTIYSQDFDGVVMPDLPALWSSNMVQTSEWISDSSNSSTGYNGSSGYNNIVVRNTYTSGLYSVTMGPISTAAFDNITVMWASRVTVNFLTPGSTTPVFEWSTNGSNWNQVTYTDNPANSIYDLVNGGVPIALPSACNNQPTLYLRWNVNIVNDPQGTYRIDDLIIRGVDATSFAEYQQSLVGCYPNPSNGILNISSASSIASIEIFDVRGQRTFQQGAVFHEKAILNLIDLGLNSGMYMIKITLKDGNVIHKRIVLM